MSSDEVEAKVYVSTITPEKYYTYAQVCNAYLAGLEAGRPKWHRLQAGQVQILPAVGETVLNEHGDKVMYIGKGLWRVYSEYSEYYEKCVEVKAPTAWCSIPTFEGGNSEEVH